MRIGVIGSGDVGRALGHGLAALGHDVQLGSREPASTKLAEWVKKCHGHASTGTFAAAAEHGEAIVLATLWSGTESALDLAGRERFANKIVMDVTNPLVFEPNKLPSLALGHTNSGGEQIQRWLPQARVVKVFNIVGNAHMVNPDFPDGPPDMFLCGNDESAKRTVIDICHTLGWPNVTDLGGLEGARLLEPLCILWVAYGALNSTWNHAFKVLRK